MLFDIRLVVDDVRVHAHARIYLVLKYRPAHTLACTQYHVILLHKAEKHSGGNSIIQATDKIASPLLILMDICSLGRALFSLSSLFLISSLIPWYKSLYSKRHPFYSWNNVCSICATYGQDAREKERDGYSMSSKHGMKKRWGKKQNNASIKYLLMVVWERIFSCHLLSPPAVAAADSIACASSYVYYI